MFPKAESHFSPRKFSSISDGRTRLTRSATMEKTGTHTVVILKIQRVHWMPLVLMSLSSFLM